MSPVSGGHASSVLPVDTSVLEQIVQGRHGNPHGVLGAHVHDGAVTVRAFRPLAESVVVVHGTKRTPLAHEHGTVLDPGPSVGCWRATEGSGSPAGTRKIVACLAPLATTVAGRGGAQRRFLPGFAKISTRASGEGPADGGANPDGHDGGADGSASGGDEGPADGGANVNGHDGGADGSAY